MFPTVVVVQLVNDSIQVNESNIVVEVCAIKDLETARSVTVAVETVPGSAEGMLGRFLFPMNKPSGLTERTHSSHCRRYGLSRWGLLNHTGCVLQQYFLCQRDHP